MTDADPFPKRDPRNRRSRLEVRIVLALVALVIVVGAIWVLVNGSPTADRRIVDSSDRGPATIIGERKASPAP